MIIPDNNNIVQNVVIEFPKDVDELSSKKTKGLLYNRTVECLNSQIIRNENNYVPYIITASIIVGVAVTIATIALGLFLLISIKMVPTGVYNRWGDELQEIADGQGWKLIGSPMFMLSFFVGLGAGALTMLIGVKIGELANYYLNSAHDEFQNNRTADVLVTNEDIEKALELLDERGQISLLESMNFEQLAFVYTLLGEQTFKERLESVKHTLSTRLWSEILTCKPDDPHVEILQCPRFQRLLTNSPMFAKALRDRFGEAPSQEIATLLNPSVFPESNLQGDDDYNITLTFGENPSIIVKRSILERSNNFKNYLDSVFTVDVTEEQIIVNAKRSEIIDCSKLNISYEDFVTYIEAIKESTGFSANINNIFTLLDLANYFDTPELFFKLQDFIGDNIEQFTEEQIKSFAKEYNKQLPNVVEFRRLQLEKVELTIENWQENLNEANKLNLKLNRFKEFVISLGDKIEVTDENLDDLLLLYENDLNSFVYKSKTFINNQDKVEITHDNCISFLKLSGYNKTYEVLLERCKQYLIKSPEKVSINIMNFNEIFRIAIKNKELHHYLNDIYHYVKKYPQDSYIDFSLQLAIKGNLPDISYVAFALMLSKYNFGWKLTNKNVFEIFEICKEFNIPSKEVVKVFIDNIKTFDDDEIWNLINKFDVAIDLDKHLKLDLNFFDISKYNFAKTIEYASKNNKELLQKCQYWAKQDIDYVLTHYEDNVIVHAFTGALKLEELGKILKYCKYQELKPIFNPFMKKGWQLFNKLSSEYTEILLEYAESLQYVDISEENFEILLRYSTLIKDGDLRARCLVFVENHEWAEDFSEEINLLICSDIEVKSKDEEDDFRIDEYVLMDDESNSDEFEVTRTFTKKEEI